MSTVTAASTQRPSLRAAAGVTWQAERHCWWGWPDHCCRLPCGPLLKGEPKNPIHHLRNVRYNSRSCPRWIWSIPPLLGGWAHLEWRKSIIVPVPFWTEGTFSDHREWTKKWKGNGTLNKFLTLKLVSYWTCISLRNQKTASYRQKPTIGLDTNFEIFIVYEKSRAMFLANQII